MHRCQENSVFKKGITTLSLEKIDIPLTSVITARATELESDLSGQVGRSKLWKRRSVWPLKVNDAKD